MIRSLLFIIFIFNLFLLNAQQDIRIGLFQDRLLSRFVFHCTEGEYRVENGVEDIWLKKGELLYLSLAGDKIMAGNGSITPAYFEYLNFKDITGRGNFRIKPVEPSGDARNYDGELELAIKYGSLQLINKNELDLYLAGVVETEGGPSAHEEYYKAQAILCRTYAVKNYHAHKDEGFNLCDHTHCQAYKGKSELNPVIPEAVLSTHNLLLTGRFIALVDAVYHSNSGGETQRASDIWAGGAEHLQSVVDPFSLDMPNTKWAKSLSAESWKDYLLSHNMTLAETLTMEELLISQPNRRRYFVLGSDTLRIDLIKSELKLRSAFFDMELQTDTVLFRGRGYGHGVGMSQEGAMSMAKQGYSFSDILRFYYHQVQIRDLMDIPDANLPEEFRFIHLPGL